MPDFQSSTLTTNLTRPAALNGADAATGDERALLLKLFSGEMFKGFQRNTIARDLVMKRTLKNGRSLQFIYTGRTTAEYHTPGNSIMGDSNGRPPVAEKTITCDDLLISSAFVYELDEVLSHYDLRSEISRKIGYALAEKYDRMIFRAITRGARAASPVQMSNYEEPGGTQISVGTADTDVYNSSKLIEAFYNAAAAMDEKGVSQDGRVAVLNPRQFYALLQQKDSNGLVSASELINRDAGGTALQSGKGVIEVAGIKIYKSMNIPFLGKYGTKYDTASGVNDSDVDPGVENPGNTGDHVEVAMETQNRVTGTAVGARNDYGANTNFSKSCGLIFQREAAGCVEGIAPQVQTTSGDVSVIYQGDVILGRLAMGADYLNPAAACELYVGAAKPEQFGKQNTDSGTAGTYDTSNQGYE